MGRITGSKLLASEKENSYSLCMALDHQSAAPAALTGDVRAPRQDRSRQTLARFLAAGEKLFAEQLIERVTVPAIAAAARSSVGAFYKRFPDKDAFLAAFYDMFFTRIRAEAREELRAERWNAKTAREVIHGWMLGRLEHYRRHRALLANLFLHLRSHGDERFVRHALEFGDELTAGLIVLRSAPRSDLPAPPTETHLRLLIGIGSAALRERILYGRSPSRTEATDRDYAETTAQMIWLELGTPSPAPNLGGEA